MSKFLGLTNKKIVRSAWGKLPRPIQARIRRSLSPDYNRSGYFHVMAPFRTLPDNGGRSRVTMILPSVRREHITGGPATLVNFMTEIKSRLPQFDLRFLPVMVPFGADDDQLPKSLADFEMFTGAEVEAGADARWTIVSDAALKSSALPVRKNEIFVATMWPTFFVAKALQCAQLEYFGAKHPMPYIIQDYEPLALFPWSDFYLLARQTYEDGDSTIALVATASLSEYMDQAGHAFAAKYTFDPGLNATSIHSGDLRPKTETFIVYGRPDTPRNCFNLIFEALLKVTAEHPEIARRFQFISVGEKHPSFKLHNGAKLVSRGFMKPEAYKDLTLRAAAGIYFVVSPHTGYVALELARCGALVVSNSFETKHISMLHPNIREPNVMSVEGVANAIVAAIEDFWADNETGLRAARADLEARERDKTKHVNFPFLEDMFSNDYRSSPEMTKRALIYHHFDRDNLVDDHVIYTLDAAKNFGCDIIFGSNSALPEDELAKLRRLTSDITLRENRGYDFASWKQMLLAHGREYFDQYDELIVANSTFYGPLFPFEEIFERMEGVDCDFWAPTKHSASHGFPEHVQPYFLVVRKPLLQSDVFWKFWKSVKDDYKNAWEVIWHAEIRLSHDFVGAGFRPAVYADLDDVQELRDLGHYEPYALHAAHYLIETQRLPFLKVKAFYANPDRSYSHQQFIFSSMDWTDSPYPRELIRHHLTRTTSLSWSKNANGTLLITETGPSQATPSTQLTIGVFAHLFYIDKLDFLIRYLANIPFPFEFNVTTPRPEIKRELEERLKEALPNMKELDIRLVENRGRDIAPWILEFRDKQLRYDLGLKVHVKQHAQQPDVFAHLWNRFLFDCVLGSQTTVKDIVSAFENDETLGILFPTYPPSYSMRFPRGYMGNVEDQEERIKAFQRLGIAPPAETGQPIFSAGGIEWYRPKALEKLFTSDITIEDFPPEPFPTSGTFGHGLERAIPYVAQAAGYSYKLCISLSVLKSSFQMYEDRIMSTYAPHHAGHVVSQTANKFARWLFAFFCARLPGVAWHTNSLAAKIKMQSIPLGPIRFFKRRLPRGRMRATSHQGSQSR